MQSDSATPDGFTADPAVEPYALPVDDQDQPAVQAGSSPSSDAGSYEDAGIYRIDVSYVDESGNEIAPRVSIAVQDGQSWSQASPTLGGYTLVDPGQATLSGVAGGDVHDLSFTVAYRQQTAVYHVVTELEAEGGYYIFSDETRTGIVGQSASVAPPAISGYHCVTTGSDLSTTVTSDGQATVTLRYDLDTRGYGIYYVTNGSYVPAQTGEPGTAIVAPANPTRTGYTFAGWDIDGDGVADALPTTIADHDVTATAVWAPGQTQYTIDYMVEDPNGSYEVNGVRYRLGARGTVSGALTGSTTHFDESAAGLDTHMTSATDHGAFAYWTLSTRNLPVERTIAADGSTVETVYYDRKRVPVYLFQNSTSTPLIDPDTNEQVVIEVPFGENFDMSPYLSSRYVPADSNFVNSVAIAARGAVSLNVIGSTYYRYITSVDSEGNASFSYVMVFTTSETARTHILGTYQNVGAPIDYSETNYTEGAGDDEYTNLMSASRHYYRLTYDNGRFHAVAWRYSDGQWRAHSGDETPQSDARWGEWHYLTPEQIAQAERNGYFDTDPSQTIANSNAVEIMWARDTHHVRYHGLGSDSQWITTPIEDVTLQYGAPVNAEAVDPGTGPADQRFLGWSIVRTTDPTEARYIDADATLPGSDMDLYAVWAHPDVTVTFDTGGGTAVASQTFAWDGTAIRPANPTREGYRFGEWYYFGTHGGVLDTVPSRYSFDRPVEGDITLYASWEQTNQPTTYTVRYVSDDGVLIRTDTFAGAFVGDTVFVSPTFSGPWQYADAAGRSLTLVDDAGENVVTFVLSRDASHAYRVRYVEEGTGRDLLNPALVSSWEAVRDFLAPHIDGYDVLHGGVGYAIAAAGDGTSELVFLYRPVAAPTPGPGPETPMTPKQVTDTPAVPLGAEPAYAAEALAAEPNALPATGDDTTSVPIGIASIGALFAALAARLRLRRDSGKSDRDA